LPEKLSGLNGSPESCAARFSSVIVLPLRPGTFTDSGRYIATGSSSFISPRSTMSISSKAVNVLVVEPISKSVPPSTGLSVPLSSFPATRSLLP